MYNLRVRIISGEKMGKRSITFEEKYNYKNNSMDIIRLILAIVVIYGHTFPVLYGPGLASPSGKYDFLAMFSKNQIGSGTVMVYMFFIISGFLITQSLINSKSISEYFIKRAMRIIPPLFLSLALSMFVFGAIVTKLSLLDYLRNPANPFAYLFYNLTFGIFGFHYSVADVYCTNPLSGSINASMWTLPFEVACYILIAIMSINNVFKKRERVIYIYIIFLILAYYNLKFGYLPFKLNDNFWLLGSNQLGSLIVFGYYFMSGSLIFCYKDKIKYSWKIFVPFILLLLFTMRFGYLKYIMLVLLPYLTMYLSCLKPIINIKKIGDFSYGSYIYAFPIQQFLEYYLGNKLGFVQFFILSIFCTLCVAVPSWYFMEKPILKMKTKVISA